MKSLALALLVVTIASPVEAETIWERTRLGLRIEEKLTRQSVERVVLGRGDERDLMRVRVSLITLSRGEIDDPRTIVLLLRLRREMGLSPASSAPALLRLAQQGDLSLTERSWAYLEAAHLALAKNKLGVAHQQLDRALAHAWQSQVRSEALVLRGFVALRGASETAALVDFAEMQKLPVSRRLYVQAQLGEAVAYALRGDRRGVDQRSREAYLTEARRASVSRLDPFWDISLGAIERKVVRALLLGGEANVPDLSERDARAARLQACALLRTTAEEDRETDSSSAPGWGKSAASALYAMWEESCAAAASAPGDDEDDL